MTNHNEIEEVRTDLSIEEHIDLHRKGFFVQKIGLIFIGFLILLAAIGAFGDGVVSKKTFSGPGTIVEFQRFYRFEARMPMNIKTIAQNGRSTISFESHYLKKLKVESINPEPTGSMVKDNSVHFVFEGTGEMDITFYLIPQHFGSLDGTLKVNDQQFSIHNFIYP